ncbi:MAG: dipeptidase [Chitinophagales bacterium]
MQQSQYIESSKQRFLDELFDLLRIPSISADGKYKEAVHQAGEFVLNKLIESGADNVEMIETAGHPIVYGEKIIDKSLPTVLVYGHYDVQPPDPLDLWTTPPFEPTIRNEKIYARGACDDKGQMYSHLKAFETMMKTDSLPCNVKFLIEGEEEVGSPNLLPFVRENKEKLQSDVVLISDTSMIANDCPSISVGTRGIAAAEIELTGPNRDLHSGTYGGAVGNPLNILSKMMASLHDEDKHITIPGFYDNVEELSDAERAEMAKRPFILKAYEDYLEIGSVQGEKGYTTIERTSIRPTLDLNGMWGGYQGEGSKTVLPSKANAKITMRLVPNQEPHRILELFKKHIEEIAPPSVKVEITMGHGAPPAVTPTDSTAYQAASKAMEATFGKTPIPTRMGGSIPIVALFEYEMNVKTVLMGFGLNEDAIHSPDESYGLFNYFKGIETIPYFYKYFTELSQG